jgi:hypothetical protein
VAEFNIAFPGHFTMLSLVSISSNGRIADELEGMWKEMTMDECRLYLICQVNRETTENHRMVCTRFEVRKKYLRNTNLERYRYTNLLGNMRFI